MKTNDYWNDFGYLWDVNDIPDGLGTEGERLMEVKNYADELIEEDIIDDEYKFIDEDFEIDEDGEIDYFTLKDSVDLDGKKEEYLDKLVYDAGDPQQWYIDNFGIDSVKDLVNDGYATLDENKIASEVIAEDGVAWQLASYDGEEIDLGEDMFAYRTN